MAVARKAGPVSQLANSKPMDIRPRQIWKSGRTRSSEQKVGLAARHLSMGRHQVCGELSCPTADSAIPARKPSISVTLSSATPPAPNAKPEAKSSKVDGIKISLGDIMCAKLIYDGLVCNSGARKCSNYFAHLYNPWCRMHSDRLDRQSCKSYRTGNACTVWQPRCELQRKNSVLVR